MSSDSPYDSPQAAPPAGPWLSATARRRLKWFGWITTLALLGLFLLVAALRSTGPTAKQQAALAVLREPLAPLQGRDGATAAWLFDHVVPEKDWPAAFAELRRYHFEYSALADHGKKQQAERLPHPLRSYPERSVPANDEGICEKGGEGCLEFVREDLRRADGLLVKHGDALQASLALARYDGFRFRETQVPMARLPTFGGDRGLVLTHFAAQFARGERTGSIDALCSDIHARRRHAEEADTLVSALVFSSYVRNDLLLLGDMLAEMPAGQALSPACMAALVPVRPAEPSLCEAMRGEFDFSVRKSEKMASWAAGQGVATGWAAGSIDTENYVSRLAPAYAHFCSATVQQAQGDDLPIVASIPESTLCGPLDYIGDPVGCMLSELTPMDQFAKYADRRTDFVATIALMRTVVWLRETSDDASAWPALLPKRPASLGLKREPKISADGARISIVLLDQSRDEEFSLPLRPATAAITPSDVAARSSH